MSHFVELEFSSCPMGCEEGDVTVVTGHDRIHHLPGEYVVVRCKHCGLMRTNPRPTSQSMGCYYPDEYGPYKNFRAFGNFGCLKYWKQWVRQIFRFNTACLPLEPPGRLLEIGCASGSFLHKMAARGWDAEGIEFSEKASDSARSLGYAVHTGTLEHAPDPKHQYDMVVGWMVLEHLHDPIVAIRKLRRWVRPGGWLAISVPNADSLEFRIFKERWYALQLPTHLYHYTPRTLRAMLSLGGWEVANIFHQRTLSNLIATLGYWLKDHNMLCRLSDKLIHYPDHAILGQYLLYPLAFILSCLGQTGRMTIWARRIDD